MKNFILLILSFLIFSCDDLNKDYSFNGKDINMAEDGSPLHHPNYDTVEKYSSSIRNFEKQVLNDSTVIKFNIYSDCCQTPKDDVKYSNDTIYVSPSFESGTLCDSYCEYLFEYHFSNEVIKNKKIIVR
jgi:hypothetical protein